MSVLGWKQCPPSLPPGLEDTRVPVLGTEELAPGAVIGGVSPKPSSPVVQRADLGQQNGCLRAKYPAPAFCCCVT